MVDPLGGTSWQPFGRTVWRQTVWRLPEDFQKSRSKKNWIWDAGIIKKIQKRDPWPKKKTIFALNILTFFWKIIRFFWIFQKKIKMFQPNNVFFLVKGPAFEFFL